MRPPKLSKDKASEILLRHPPLCFTVVNIIADVISHSKAFLRQVEDNGATEYPAEAWDTNVPCGEVTHRVSVLLELALDSEGMYLERVSLVLANKGATAVLVMQDDVKLEFSVDEGPREYTVLQRGGGIAWAYLLFKALVKITRN